MEVDADVGAALSEGSPEVPLRVADLPAKKYPCAYCHRSYELKRSREVHQRRCFSGPGHQASVVVQQTANHHEQAPPSRANPASGSRMSCQAAAGTSNVAGQPSPLHGWNPFDFQYDTGSGSQGTPARSVQRTLRLDLDAAASVDDLSGATSLHIVPQPDPGGVDESVDGGEADADEHFEPEVFPVWEEDMFDPQDMPAFDIGPRGTLEEGREGTIKWYRTKLDHKLCDGSPTTLEQYCYEQLTIKQNSAAKDDSSDDQLRSFARSMPQPNCCPPSLYIMRRLVVHDSPHDFEYHVCPNECHVYPFRPRSAWDQHLDDECPICHELRFSGSTSGSPKPQKRFWYLGVRNMLQLLAKSPHWSRLRGQGRSSRRGDYWRSAEFQRLCKATRGVAADRDRSVLIELGLDWFQPFVSRTWSTGLLCMRCYDLPAQQRGKREYTMPLMIMPGPREPRNFDVYLGPLLEELQELAAVKSGFDLVEHVLEDGVLVPRLLQEVAVFLCSIAADSPAQRKLSKWLLHSAFLGCGWCLLNGSHSPTTKHGMYFLGYSEAVAAGMRRTNAELAVDPTGKDWPDQGGRAAGQQSARVGDPSIILSSQQQKDRAAEVDVGDAYPFQAGCHGTSLFVQALSYVDYNNLFLLPVAHAGYHGMIKGMLALWFGKFKQGASKPWYHMPLQQRKVFQARGAHVRPTCDQGRMYQDLSQLHSSTMEELAMFVDCYSVALLRDFKYVKHGSQGVKTLQMLSGDMQRIWASLRYAIIHYTRDTGLNAERASKQAACDAIRLCGALLESVRAESCTANLHSLACRAPTQDRQRGSTAFDTEFWVERYVQYCKKPTKHRAHDSPEVVLMNHLLTSLALRQMQIRQYPASADAVPELQGLAAANPGHRHSHSIRGKVLDPPATASSSHLDGTGKELTPESWGILWDALECTRQWEDADLLSPATRTAAAQFTWHHFTYASVKGSEQVQSEDYLRSRTKISHYVRVRFVLEVEGVDTEVEYVASVRFFVRATDTAALLRAHTAAEKFAAAKRFAVVRLYDVKEENEFWGQAYVAEGRRTHPPEPQYDPYVVPLDKLSLGKVVFVPSVTPIGDMQPAKQEFVFLPYSHHYSAIDADAPVDYEQ